MALDPNYIKNCIGELELQIRELSILTNRINNNPKKNVADIMRLTTILNNLRQDLELYIQLDGTCF